ncbi:hypothetical protein P7K49_010761 [Saguinus oedipus]|uniref:Uncharacterized protein n=1 Tax=Saguinus oedipus TaxID=9490 RepID=A0ABQ9VPH5_SAGOE|nr:hypothetical protein P7K49_010761 [Saguinus oedipus]
MAEPHWQQEPSSSTCGVCRPATLLLLASDSTSPGLSLKCHWTYGSQNLKHVGVILQRSALILLLCCFPCWALFLNTQHILLLFRQDPGVSRCWSRRTPRLRLLQEAWTKAGETSRITHGEKCKFYFKQERSFTHFTTPEVVAKDPSVLPWLGSSRSMKPVYVGLSTFFQISPDKHE